MPKTTVRWVTGRQFVGMDANQHAVVLSGENDPNGVRKVYRELTHALGVERDDLGVAERPAIVGAPHGEVALENQGEEGKLHAPCW